MINTNGADQVLIAELKKRNEKLEEALKHIRRHVEVSSPTGYIYSGAWNIANNALSDELSEWVDEFVKQQLPLDSEARKLLDQIAYEEE